MMKMSLKVVSCLCLIQASSALAFRGQGQIGQQAQRPEAPSGFQGGPIGGFEGKFPGLPGGAPGANQGGGQQGQQPGGSRPTNPGNPGSGSGNSSAEPTAQVLSSTCPVSSTQMNKMSDQSLVVSSYLGVPATYGRDLFSHGQAQVSCGYSVQITPPKGFQVLVLSSSLQGRAQVGLNDSLQFSLAAKSGSQTLSGALSLGAQGKKSYAVNASGQPAVGACAQPVTVDVQAAYSLRVGENTFAEVEANPFSSVVFAMKECQEVPPAGTVLGQVTSVTHEGKELIFKGWMCVVGTPAPTSVTLKLSSGAGQNPIYKGRTNLPSPEGVSQKCGDSRDIPRGFDIRFSYNGLDLNGRQAAEDLRGKTIYFYGTRPGSPSTDVEFAQSVVRQDF